MAKWYKVTVIVQLDENDMYTAEEKFLKMLYEKPNRLLVLEAHNDDIEVIEE